MAFLSPLPQPNNQPPLFHDLHVMVHKIDITVKRLHHPEDRMIMVTYRLPPRSAGLPSYAHASVAKLLYVQRGALAVALDADVHHVAAGQFVPVAAGVLHACWNATDEEVAFVACFSSIDVHVVFDELAALTMKTAEINIA